MRRRDFINLFGGLVGTCACTTGQQVTDHRIFWHYFGLVLDLVDCGLC
jgi:hypothetical protein